MSRPPVLAAFVGDQRLQLVAARRGVVRAVVAGEWSSPEGLEQAMSEAILALTPKRTWRRPRMSVVLGPSLYRLRRLHGTPLLAATDNAGSEVRDGVGRYIPVDPGALAVYSLTKPAGGLSWLMWANADVVKAIRSAVRRAGMSLGGILPVASVLAVACGDGEGVFADGRDGIHFQAAAGQLIAHRRDTSPSEGNEGAELSPDLWKATVLCSAAIEAKRRNNPLFTWSAAHTTPNTRRRIAATALAGAALACITSPILSPWILARGSEAALSRLQERVAILESAWDELGESSAALKRIESLRSRARAIPLLATLAERLPADVAIASFHFDTTTSRLTLLGSRVSAALAELDGAPGFWHGQLTSAVSKEREDLQRLSLSFQLRRTSVSDVSSGSQSRTAEKRR